MPYMMLVVSQVMSSAFFLRCSLSLCKFANHKLNPSLNELSNRLNSAIGFHGLSIRLNNVAGFFIGNLNSLYDLIRSRQAIITKHLFEFTIVNETPLWFYVS